MKMNDILLRIGYFRNREKLTAKALSKKLNKHDGYINKLESKDFNLSTKMLLEILNELNVEAEEFFAENFANYKVDKELLDLVKNLPNDKKDNLLELIKK